MSERVILHADMDAFYASVEQRDHPEYRGKPVIVGATSARGVVSAASYEARKFGVRSAMPGFRAHELCPEGIFLSGDMKKYAAVSRVVHEVFAEFTNEIEPLALDEAFLDITGSVKLMGSPLEIGRRIKERVRERTELTVSVGIGPNKLVAKIACSRGKPNGLLLIEPEGVKELLDPLPVRALYGIGPKAGEKLEKAGFFTVAQIASASLDALEPLLGNQSAELRDRARGIDDRPVESDRAPHSIGEENTFHDDVTSRERISDALTVHSEAIAGRARRAGYVGRTVTIKVKLSRRKPGKTSAAAARGDQRMSAHDLFPQLSRQLELPAPTADANEIRRAALFLWERLGLTEPIRLIGVTLSKLEVPRERAQLDLFAPRALAVPKPDAAPAPAIATRGEQLGRALDAISDRFGTGAVRRAVEDPGKITISDKKKIGEKD